MCLRIFQAKGRRTVAGLLLPSCLLGVMATVITTAVVPPVVVHASGPSRLTEFSIPTTGSGSLGMTASTVGGDGNLWYVGNLANTVGKITPAGRVTEYALAAGSSPYAITWGPDGNVWFVDEGSAKVGRITPSGTITTYSTPTASSRPAGITVGPDGNLWFTEYGVSNVGKITTAGTITEYPIGSTSNPVGIATGADGNLWFAEESGNHVGRMTTSGTVTQYAVTASSTPYAITAGPDGNLWFTEADGNNIGKVTTGGTVTCGSPRAITRRSGTSRHRDRSPRSAQASAQLLRASPSALMAISGSRSGPLTRSAAMRFPTSAVR